MAEISVHKNDSGRWLLVKDFQETILGAFIQPHATPGTPITITWSGLPEEAALLRFCEDSAGMFASSYEGAIRRGRAFANGRAHRFEGADWLKAANIENPVFLRFDCFSGVTSREDGFVLWGRVHDTDGANLEDGENIGVQLQPSRLMPLQQRIAELVRSTRKPTVNTAAVVNALNEIVRFVDPGSAPLVAYAAA